MRAGRKDRKEREKSKRASQHEIKRKECEREERRTREEMKYGDWEMKGGRRGRRMMKRWISVEKERKSDWH